MNKRRLLKLADLLEADAKKKRGIRFNLSVVGMAEINDDKTVKLNCSTSACAMGLAAMSGAFKSEGLSYKIRKGGWLNNIDCTIDGKTHAYIAAAKTIFGISHSAAHFLFTPINYPSDKKQGAVGERYVAKRIRDFVAGKVHPETAVSP